MEEEATATPEKTDEVELRISRYTAEFVDPDVEDSFRRSGMEAEAHRLATVLLFGGMLFPLFAIPDLVQLGVNSTTMAILAAECSVALGSLLMVVRLKKNPARVLSYGPITALEALAMGTALLATYLRPEQILTVQLTFCVLVLALFTFIPNRFLNDVIVNSLGLVAMVLISMFVPPPELRSDPKTVMALVTVTVVCGWAGKALAQSRREGYSNLLQERWSNARLLEEISRRQALEEELTWLADHDTLTDVLNRRAFFEQAERQLSTARRMGRPLSVLVIDADRFKSINDDFGHHTGDEAIRTIARLCKVNLRADDLVGRLGGEEFAVVMPAAGLRVAEEVAGRLRQRVAEHQIEHPEGPVSFTISIGVVECQPWSDASVQDAIQRADEAMYEAKAAGRNRVVAVPV